jgi:hypothetical protein
MSLRSRRGTLASGDWRWWPDLLELPDLLPLANLLAASAVRPSSIAEPRDFAQIKICTPTRGRVDIVESSVA